MGITRMISNILNRPPMKCISRGIKLGHTTIEDEYELNNELKCSIENHWKKEIQQTNFDINSKNKKFYIIPMFPYPSGNLHMGHVRVYTISDTIARFHRLRGENVFHPMGWDAFGLPAENAAIERDIKPSEWTKQNIKQMKNLLLQLGCAFNWENEISTCDPRYFKWTQKLFLLLLKNGLVYQKWELVNWDPIDMTVLADEQVDINGCSWRSGAKVEKKLLKQWFVRTTKFAKVLYEDLENLISQDWRDIINLQKHWIGECNGYSFDLDLRSNKFISDLEDGITTIRIWTEEPSYLMDINAFVVIKSSNYLRLLPECENLKVYNPFTKKLMNLIFSDEITFPEHSDIYLASPNEVLKDRNLAEKFNLSLENTVPSTTITNVKNRNFVIEYAKKLNIGGYQVSAKLKDWLISRQRKWGTPIPIIHCENCGSVPINDDNLLEEIPKHLELAYNNKKGNIKCPKCKNENSYFETDTMDTFFDSSWYYLRFLSSQNNDTLFDQKIINYYMPVDLYIGGKEHAVLHLYYARFINQFLYSLGNLKYSEPFKRLLVQGMVMGRTFKSKITGKYMKDNEVRIVNEKLNKAVVIATNEPIDITWEKMSKSKHNGVEPSELISTYGVDTVRLIILGDVAPMSHRKWTSQAFPGIIKWQKRMWSEVNRFCKIKQTKEQNSIESDKVATTECILYDARNYYVKGVTFHYAHTHQLSVALSKMQGLTNSLRRCKNEVIKFSEQYERALAAQIIMLAPMAPCFASELWYKFSTVPEKLIQNSKEFNFECNVLDQCWPGVDLDYKLDLKVKCNGFDITSLKIPRNELDNLPYDKAVFMAYNIESVQKYLSDKIINKVEYERYQGCDAVLHFMVDKIKNK